MASPGFGMHHKHIMFYIVPFNVVQKPVYKDINNDETEDSKLLNMFPDLLLSNSHCFVDLVKVCSDTL